MADDGCNDVQLTIFAISDTGSSGENIQACARALAQRAEINKPSFVLLCGDNFYEHGIQSRAHKGKHMEFERQWEHIFLRPYPALRVPWYAVLGNHDLERNARWQAEIDFTNSHHNPGGLWRMPDRSYRFRTEFSCSADQTAVVKLCPAQPLQVNLEEADKKEEPAPVASKAVAEAEAEVLFTTEEQVPKTVPDSADDSAENDLGADFDNNADDAGDLGSPAERSSVAALDVFAIDTNALSFYDPHLQKLLTSEVSALEEILPRSSARFKIVIGHHPCFTAGNSHSQHASRLRTKYSLAQVLEDGGADLYVSGHEHVLQGHLSGGVDHFVVGASCKNNFFRGRNRQIKLDFIGSDDGNSVGFLEITIRNSGRTMRMALISSDGKEIYVRERHKPTVRQDDDEKKH